MDFGVCIVGSVVLALSDGTPKLRTHGVYGWLLKAPTSGQAGERSRGGEAAVARVVTDLYRKGRRWLIYAGPVVLAVAAAFIVALAVP